MDFQHPWKHPSPVEKLDLVGRPALTRHIAVTRTSRRPWGRQTLRTTSRAHRDAGRTRGRDESRRGPSTSDVGDPWVDRSQHWVSPELDRSLGGDPSPQVPTPGREEVWSLRDQQFTRVGRHVPEECLCVLPPTLPGPRRSRGTSVFGVPSEVYSIFRPLPPGRRGVR